jgi:hypothetical protein
MSGLEESYFELLKARKVLIVGNVDYKHAIFIINILIKFI